MPKKFHHYTQLDQMDCGPTCLRMIAKYYGKSYTAQRLRESAKIGRDGVSMYGLSDAAEVIGFETKGAKINLKKLTEDVPLPCILHWGQNHFVVLYSVTQSASLIGSYFLGRIWGAKKLDDYNDQDSVSTLFMKVPLKSKILAFLTAKKDVVINGDTVIFKVADPAKGLVKYTTKEFIKHWSIGENEGLALLLEPTARFYEEKDDKTTSMKFTQMLAYVWQYKGLLLQLVLGMLLGSGLSLILPFLTQSLVDIGVDTQNLPYIYIILIAQLVLLCSISAIDFLRSWILLHISTRLNLTILSEFLAKILRLPLSFFDVKQMGDIMQRIGDQQRIESFLTGQTLNILFSIFNMLVFGVVLAYYNVVIFMIAIVLSVLYAIWIILFFKRRRNLDIKRFAVSSKNQSQTIQLIQGMQDIKLSGAETVMRWDWERTQTDLFKWNVKSLSLSQTQQAGAILINQSKNIIITFLAAKAVIDGQMTLGGMMSVQYILGQFNAPIEQMIVFLQSWQDAQISLERLNEVHDLPDEEPAFEAKLEHWNNNQNIKISNLYYTYPGAGELAVLKNINLIIPYGKTTAFVGMSGSGKTTLLKILLRFYEQQKGEIFLVPDNKGVLFSQENKISTLSESNGIDIKLISQKAWRKRCGVVMQDGFIFSDTIAKNIAVGEDIINQDQLISAAKIASIHQFIASLPLGYNTKIGGDGNGLSQGQKQRILIARAVYKNPDLLIFDEATNSLDTNNEAIIMSKLNEFFKGRTVLTVAHRLSTVRYADQIVVMEAGEIVEVGTHTELVNLGQKYYQLVSTQLDLTDVS